MVGFRYCEYCGKRRTENQFDVEGMCYKCEEDMDDACSARVEESDRTKREETSTNAYHGDTIRDDI